MHETNACIPAAHALRPAKPNKQLLCWRLPPTHLGAQELVGQRAAAQQVADLCKAAAVVQQAGEGRVILVGVCRQQQQHEGWSDGVALELRPSMAIRCRRPKTAHTPAPPERHCSAAAPAPTQREVRALVTPHRARPLLVDADEAGHVVRNRRATHCKQAAQEAGTGASWAMAARVRKLEAVASTASSRTTCDCPLQSSVHHFVTSSGSTTARSLVEYTPRSMRPAPLTLRIGT